MTNVELEELIGMSDPDGVWSLCKDFSMHEEMEYIEEKYFSNEEDEDVDKDVTNVYFKY